MIDVPTKHLHLPQVTLCAASSVNIDATIRALESSLKDINFASCKLFTDISVELDHPHITVVRIPRLNSSADYSDFLLRRMVDQIDTSHCLIVQWDGHVQNAHRWQSEFLNYDYIGASWPQFTDGHDVGNGGFSLRSKRLMELCREPGFRSHEIEDIAIGRVNRDWLESRGLKFAPTETANLFSTERAGNIELSFGYHGSWLMPQAIGLNSFWEIYRGLDDRGTIWHDLSTIRRQVRAGPKGWRRALYLSVGVRKRKKARVRYISRAAFGFAAVKHRVRRFLAQSAGRRLGQ